MRHTLLQNWAAWVLAKDAHSNEALCCVLLGTIRKGDWQLGGVYRELGDGINKDGLVITSDPNRYGRLECDAVAPALEDALDDVDGEAFGGEGTRCVERSSLDLGSGCGV